MKKTVAVKYTTLDLISNKMTTTTIPIKYVQRTSKSRYKS